MDIRNNFNCLLSTSKHNLSTAKPQKSVKDYFQSRVNENKLDKLICKTTQVNLEGFRYNEFSKDLPTESYWKVVAEKRRIALEEALTENERLCKIHEDLIKENTKNKELLEEANSFIEVVKELTNDSPNDTGIDLNNSLVS